MKQTNSTRFFALLKKELKELITIQMLLPMIIGACMFAFIGNIVGNETEKASMPKDLYIVDFDQSNLSNTVIDTLEQSNFKPNILDVASIDEAITLAKENDIKLLLEIDKGFESGINNLEKQTLHTYTIINNFSIGASIGSSSIRSSIEAINQYLSDAYIKNYSSIDDLDLIKQPVVSIDHTQIGDNIATISPGEVTSFILSQTTFIPIIMFIIIIFASQMTAVSIASEKENKTLETLLSTPISRITLVATKMLSAAIASLIMAAVYMFGFRIYMNGITGGMLDSAQTQNNALSTLGLEMSVSGYILLGATLFLSILIALAISMILGAFAEDVKKVQGLISPIIFLVMIPYIISMFVDLTSTSLLIKVIVYIIPFSHTFIAAPNIFLHQYTTIYLGIAYQAIVFVILVIIAGKIFSSDKILTLKLNFGKKNKYTRKKSLFTK